MLKIGQQIVIDGKAGTIIDILKYDFLTKNGFAKYPEIVIVEFKEPNHYVKVYLLETII